MLSHHHKSIFIHIPKCAGQSVETAFLSDLNLTWETRAPLLLRYNDNSQLGPPRLAHLTASDYVRCRYVTEEMFNAYYRFAIVRNPWSRTVALYRHLNLKMRFREFVCDWLASQFAERQVASQYWFVRPQMEFVSDGGKQLVNDILRFERLNDEFDCVVAATGLKTPLPHVNKSNGRQLDPSSGNFFAIVRSLLQPSRREEHDHWKKFYHADTAEIVKKLYEADVLGFDYSFDSSG